MFSSYSDPDLDWMFSSHSKAKLKPERSSEEIRQCKHWLREVYPLKNIALSKISIQNIAFSKMSSMMLFRLAGLLISSHLGLRHHFFHLSE